MQRKLSLKTVLLEKKLFVFFFLINYRMIRTHAGAGAAFHAGIGIDPVVPVKFLNRLGRTDFPARPADNAIVSNKISHGFLLAHISTSPVEILSKFSTINGTRL